MILRGKKTKRFYLPGVGVVDGFGTNTREREQKMCENNKKRTLVHKSQTV